MTDRAHLYRVITDNQGNVNLDALTVSVFQPGTSTLIADTLYSDNSSGVSPGNPFSISNGIVDFYLATPQRVDLKVDDGSRVTIYHDLDVLEVIEVLTAAMYLEGIIAGAQVVGTNLLPPGLRVPEARTLTDIYLAVGTAPTGANLNVTIKANNTTTLGTATITAASTSGHTGSLSAAVSAGDRITVDVTQIGSTAAGSDLAVQVVLT